MTAHFSFCNDIDFTIWSSYKEIHHVLYQELGVEVQDSFWLFDPKGSDMALFINDTTQKGRYHDELLQEISDGRLNVLHSAGFYTTINTDTQPTRELILSGLEYLATHARVPKIWTNHGGAGDIQNIAGGVHSFYQGDDPSAACYILDVLLQYGFKYFWTDSDYTNEFACLGTQGKQSFMETITTRSGHAIQTFKRYRGQHTPSAETLHLQLTEGNLRLLAESHGICVLYQHFGTKIRSKGSYYPAVTPIFSQNALDSLRLLRKYVERSEIAIIPLLNLLDNYSSSADTLPSKGEDR